MRESLSTQHRENRSRFLKSICKLSTIKFSNRKPYYNLVENTFRPLIYSVRFIDYVGATLFLIRTLNESDHYRSYDL